MAKTKDKEKEVRESKAAQLLARKVQKMIGKMDDVITKLEPAQDTPSPKPPRYSDPRFILTKHLKEDKFIHSQS
jgi:hypothetical protein